MSKLTADQYEFLKEVAAHNRLVVRTLGCSTHPTMLGFFHEDSGSQIYNPFSDPDGTSKTSDPLKFYSQADLAPLLAVGEDTLSRCRLSFYLFVIIQGLLDNRLSLRTWDGKPVTPSWDVGLIVSHLHRDLSNRAFRGALTELHKFLAGDSGAAQVAAPAIKGGAFRLHLEGKPLLEALPKDLA